MFKSPCNKDVSNNAKKHENKNNAYIHTHTYTYIHYVQSSVFISSCDSFTCAYLSKYFMWIQTHWWLSDGILFYLESLGSNLFKQFTLGSSECEQSLKHIHSYTSTPKNNTDFEDMLIPKIKKKKGLSGLSYFWQLSLTLLSTDLTNSSVSKTNNIFDEASPMMWVCRTSQSG